MSDIPDKLTLLSRLPNEAQRLFDEEIKKAYKRGEEDALVLHRLREKRKEGIKEVIWVLGIISAVLLFIAGAGTTCNTIASRPPDPTPPVPKDITKTWVPLVETDAGIIYEFSPKPGVRCFQNGKQNDRFLGCVNE